MKNVIVYHFPIIEEEKDPKIILQTKMAEDFLNYQIDISLAMGWKKEDIIILSNKKIKHNGVESVFYEWKEYPFSRFVYKPLGLIYIIKELGIKDDIWSHDWDLFQVDDLNYTFPLGKDLALYYGHYARVSGKPNTGCVFMKSSAIDVLEKSVKMQIERKGLADEAFFWLVLKTQKERSDELDARYNIGRTAFKKRYNDAKKPIICFHLKVTKRGKVRTYFPYVLKQAKINQNTLKVANILKDFFNKYEFEY